MTTPILTILTKLEVSHENLVKYKKRITLRYNFVAVNLSQTLEKFLKNEVFKITLLNWLMLVSLYNQFEKNTFGYLMSENCWNQKV